jgi:hypothetical protein
MKRRMRSAKVTLGLTALMAASLTGCASEEEQPDYAAICVDPQTQTRTDDDNCTDDEREYHGSGGGFFWFYMATRGNAFVPPVGGRYNVASGTYTVPRSGSPTVRRGGLDRGGGDIGTITRGGFGKSGHGSSGG